MPMFFCNQCNRIVQDGDRHSCFFYKNDETVFNLQQPNEAEEVDINRDATTRKYAEILDDKNGNTCETAQQIRNASQASTSRVHFVSSSKNKELDVALYVEHIDSTHRRVAQDASFPAPDRKRKLDAGADQPLDLRKATVAVPGPSSIHHQTIGPDGKRLFVCDKCSYRTKHKSHFNDHYIKHTGEKPHKCDICKKCFSHKNTLEVHLRMHRGEKKYVCNTCGRRFSQNTHLVNHLRTHTGEWPYECEKCGKGFGHRAHLEQHFRIHSGERPFDCHICGRRFTTRSHLRRHVAIHGREPYRCGQCEQTFSSNEDRNRHIMQQHQRGE